MIFLFFNFEKNRFFWSRLWTPVFWSVLIFWKWIGKYWQNWLVQNWCSSLVISKRNTVRIPCALWKTISYEDDVALEIFRLFGAKWWKSTWSNHWMLFCCELIRLILARCLFCLRRSPYARGVCAYRGIAIFPTLLHLSATMSNKKVGAYICDKRIWCCKMSSLVLSSMFASEFCIVFWSWLCFQSIFYILILAIAIDINLTLFFEQVVTILFFLTYRMTEAFSVFSNL